MRTHSREADGGPGQCEIPERREIGVSTWKRGTCWRGRGMHGWTVAYPAPQSPAHTDRLTSMARRREDRLERAGRPHFSGVARNGSQRCQAGYSISWSSPASLAQFCSTFRTRRGAQHGISIRGNLAEQGS